MLQFTKERKTTAKMGNYAKKSENFVRKLVVPKVRKPSVNPMSHKIRISSIRRRE